MVKLVYTVIFIHLLC